MKTAEIKSLISNWLTDDVVAYLYGRFDFVDENVGLSDFESVVKNEKNWKREIKRKTSSGWVREFDCRPLDGQLRLYVDTNLEDSEILKFLFQDE